MNDGTNMDRTSGSKGARKRGAAAFAGSAIMMPSSADEAPAEGKVFEPAATVSVASIAADGSVETYVPPILEIPAAPDAAAEPSAAGAAATKPAPVDAAAIPPAPAAAPAPTAKTTDSAPAEPTSKGRSIMATAYETAPAADAAVTGATEKAKAMFGDMKGGAKAAMEKSVKLGEEMTEFTKGNVEAIVQSGRVAAKGAEALAQEAAETMKKHLESATATMKSFASVKSPTELFQLQSEAAKSYFDTAVADMSKYTEQLMKLAGDVAQPLSSRYSVAMEKIKATQA